MFWKLMEVPDIWRRLAILLFLHFVCFCLVSVTPTVWSLFEIWFCFFISFKKQCRADVWVFPHSYFPSFSASMLYSSCLTGCQVFTVALTKWWNLNLKENENCSSCQSILQSSFARGTSFFLVCSKSRLGKKSIPWCWNPMFVSLCLLNRWMRNVQTNQ